MSHYNHKGRPGLLGGSLPRNNLSGLFSILKGGAGSGNRGHAGRLGKRGGSGPSLIQTISIDNVNFDIKELTDFALSTGNEAVLAFDKNGNRQGSMLKGTKNHIPDTIRIINSETHLTIHNHPNSDSFSGNDIKWFAKGNEKHMVVIGHNGTIYKMSKPDNWKPGFKHDDLDSKWENRVYQGVAYGEISLPTVDDKSTKWREFSHQITSEITQEVGIMYERIK